jgi:hypothetical protein
VAWSLAVVAAKFAFTPIVSQRGRAAGRGPFFVHHDHPRLAEERCTVFVRGFRAWYAANFRVIREIDDKLGFIDCKLLRSH